MRYPVAEKLEIIRLVEGSHLPVRQTLARLGIPPATFYRWYERFQTGGPEALDDRPSRPDRVWNRIPDEVRGRIVDLALAEPELSPRELAVRFTEREGYFVSEASVYRLLKAHDLITSPAFIVVKAADEFHTKTTAPNQLWQTDFTYLKVTGWGWFYLSTVLDDFSRYVIAWKLCTGMAASDVTETLELALAASGCAQARVRHRPRLLSDNGPSYISADLAVGLPRCRGSSAGSVVVYAARSTRRRSRSKLLRPKVCRFSIFSLPTCPSVCPLLQEVVSAALTAAPSCCSPRAKVVTAATPLRVASPSQRSSVVMGAPHRAFAPRPQPRTRSANRRTRPATTAASGSCSSRAKSAFSSLLSPSRGRVSDQASLFGEESAGAHGLSSAGAGAASVGPARFGPYFEAVVRRGPSQRWICRDVPGKPRSRTSRQSAIAFSQPSACRASRWAR